MLLVCVCACVQEELAVMRSSAQRGAAGSGHAQQAPPAMTQEAACEVVYCFGCLRDLLPSAANGPAGPGPGSKGTAAQQQARGGGGGGGEAGPLVLRCPKCWRCFCFDCDVYVHENLHNCPGCELSAGSAQYGGFG